MSYQDNYRKRVGGTILIGIIIVAVILAIQGIKILIEWLKAK